MRKNDKHGSESFTVAGTNIDAVKRENEHSGMSYNEVKEFIARTTGGHGTAAYSDTDIEEVHRKNKQSAGNKKE